ncbi:MAG TPA: hypothetical protein VIK00_02300 [Candidatus Limnocylindrales bacterium]
MGAAAHLESRLIAVTPGSQASVQLRVRNTGSVVDQFTFQVLGDAQAWSTVTPPSLSLFPGAEDAVSVSFIPPRSAQVQAGQLPFGVHIISKEDAQGSVVEEGVVDVAPFSDVFAELAPRTSRGSRRASHDLAIDNRGNAPINATLSAVDPDRLLNFDVRPPGVVAQPGTATFAKIGVRPRKSFWRGQSQTRPFQVLLEGAGPTPVTVEGTMVQEAILPPWTMRALLLLAAALIALVLIWLFLLKPAIQSTAQEQTAQMLAQVGITPPPGGFKQQPPANSGPSGGATPAPGSSPGSVTNVASAPPLAGGGQPTDGRIVFGQASLQVPAGKTVFVTDLVFANPSDTATGQLRLERSGQALLVLRLEDFRDLDFHFVTPIVVAAGQSLGIGCDDPNACAGTSVYYSGYTR